MKKSDLKNLMLVETADGKVYRVIDGRLRNTYISTDIERCYTDDLYSKGAEENDIVKVYRADDFIGLDVKGKKPIWERVTDQGTVLHEVIKTYGNNAQIDVAIEEMSELTKALMKHRRAIKSQSKTDIGSIDFEEKRNNVIEEMADVEIMIQQLVMIYDCRDEVKEQIDFKVKRLQDRLKKTKTNE